jgi:Arc/MetJ family transcription regulator
MLGQFLGETRSNRRGALNDPVLTDMHDVCIFMHMRTTLNIDDALLAKAKRLSGLKEKTAIVHAGLEALVALESARRLAALGGTEKGLRAAPRRRSREAS